MPGVVIGVVIRVCAVPGPRIFRLFIAALLLPLGLWLCWRTLRPARNRRTAVQPSPRAATAPAVAVGIAGHGMPVAVVAPAALAATSVVGAGSYALLALMTNGDIAPDRLLGLACGLGGLAGGYLGARLQPRLPETALRLLLGALYVIQVLR